MSDDEPTDPLPALRAEIDQMVMLAPELARNVRGFYDAFKAEGFTDTQALYLAAVQLTQGAGKAP